MKLNKTIWIIAMVLLVSISAAFAQFGASLGGFFSNPWVIFAVNILIVWFVLAVIAAFIPQKDGKTKAVVWVLTLVLAFVIVWYLTGRGAGYIWQVGRLAGLFNIKIIVNFLIIGAAIWFGIGLLGVDAKVIHGKIGLAVLALLISGMLAYNIGDQWLWSHKNGKAAYDYLLEPQKIIKTPHVTKEEKGWWLWKNTVTTTTYTEESVGGILRPEEVNGYRLWVFLLSAMLFGWFFTGWLLPNTNAKIAWAFAIIIGANLARTGTPLTTAIALAEAFFLLIIGSQITKGTGWAGTILGWAGTIFLVEWIFCTVFHTSALSIRLANVFQGFPVIGSVFQWLSGGCEKIAGVVGTATGTGAGAAGAGGLGTGGLPTGPTAPGLGGFLAKGLFSIILTIAGLVGSLFAGGWALKFLFRLIKLIK